MAIDLSAAESTPAIGRDASVTTSWVDVDVPAWATVAELRFSAAGYVGMARDNAGATPSGSAYLDVPANGVASIPVGAVDEGLVGSDRTIRVASATGTITVTCLAYP